MRISVLLLILSLVAAGIYLNQVGLPDVLKAPLIGKLHDKGVDLQFSRLRLRWYRGIVAENVVFGQVPQGTNDPQIFIREVEVKLNHEALKSFQLSPDSLILHNGEVLWAEAETNRNRQALAVNKIETRLRFLPNDQWELENFKASVAGVQVNLSGSLTNASAMREWTKGQGTNMASPKKLQDRLNRVEDTFERIKFFTPPEINLVFHGDARNLESFDAHLTVSATGAQTPWGTLTNGLLVARLLAPSTTNQQPHADLQLHADSAQTQWASTKDFRLALRLISDETLTNKVQCQLELLAGETITPWAQATNAHFTAQWAHSPTNPIPINGNGTLTLADARTRWGTAGGFELTGRLQEPPKNFTRTANEQWAWWASLEPYYIDWNCHLTNVHAQDFKVQEVACGGTWRAPELAITNVYSELYQGKVKAQASLNVVSRELNFSYSSDFDVQKVSPALSEKSRHWIGQFSWQNPPALQGSGGFVFPSWTNRQPDWRAEVLPTLCLEGEVKLGEAAYRGIQVSSAQSHIRYTNMIWDIPDLIATRPEGKLNLAIRANDRTKDYYFRINSSIDPKVAQPLFEPQQQRIFDMISTTQPPIVDAEIWGQWYDHERIGFKAQVACRDFSFRGEAATSLRSGIEYTNHFLTLTNARVEYGTQYMAASSALFNFDKRTVAITNGFSTMEPARVLTAVGPRIFKIMEPYHFLQPPMVRLNGIIPLGSEAPVDAHFEVEGGPFQWSKFNVAHISGGVHWVGDHLNLSQIQADFYKGTLTGSAEFDFAHRKGADFGFDFIVTDSNLHLLMADLYSGTNNLQGRLSGHLTVISANTADWNSWFGKGQVDLHEGLIWEIPIFGIFSQALNDLVPGLGKSPISEAAGTFTINNSIIRSDDLEMRAPVMRMLYKGTVDFDTRVNATVEAQMFQDTWVVGPILSKVLWPVTKAFEYKVTGTLANPKREPLYIPKVLSPFQWFRSLRQALPGQSGAKGNADDAKPPQ
ncbi:AsmA-like C-terminal region-containing protein [Pedosphaera parvula]|nr:AsmA-like C-terminal region-containing protein [Pedosphaera parvula]